MSTSLWKLVQQQLNISCDGIPGAETRKALCQKLNITATSWKEVQQFLSINADGIPGRITAQKTLFTLNKLLLTQDTQETIPPHCWPKEKDVPAYFGAAGEGLQILELPYPMVLSWAPQECITRITCHTLIALPLKRIFKKTEQHYGFKQLQELGLNSFGGCFNNRNKIGGTTKSMHAYGIAVDLDPDHNSLKWNHSRARFARPEYNAFWDIVASQGALSLGKQRDYDWMHFQFTAPS